MGALRTSEDGAAVGGEAKQAKSDDNRTVDAPGRIIIDSVPVAVTPAPKPVPPPMPLAAPRSGGLGLVIVVYLLATVALAAAIYERYFM